MILLVFKFTVSIVREFYLKDLSTFPERLVHFIKVLYEILSFKDLILKVLVELFLLIPSISLATKLLASAANAMSVPKNF